MIKEEKPIFFKVLLVVVLILVINIVVFTIKINSITGMTGLSIVEKISTSYSSISTSTKIFLLIQWVILLTLLLGTFIKEKKQKPKEDELSGINLKKMADQDGTDLDTLYKILKEKKKLKLSSIMQLFKIKKEVAMNWCKTLESGNLATIEYSSAKDPTIKMIE